MKLATLCVVGIVGMILSGCGSQPGSRPISHGMTPAEVKSEVLSRLDAWHATSETVAETMTGAGGSKHKYMVTLMDQASPANFRLKVVASSGVVYEIIDNGLNVIEYQRGDPHYTVLAANAAAWSLYRLMGTELPKSLTASRMVSVSVKSKQAVLQMMTPISPGIMAKTTLWFNLVTNMPSRWQALWKGGSIVETPSKIQVNPALSPSAFRFSPPAGVTPEVGLTPQGTELDQAQSRVPFAIVLPPRGENFSLRSVNVSSGISNRVVLLTYETANQTTLVITESKSAVFKPPSGLSMIREMSGTLQVKVGTMPDGQELAALTMGKTSLVIEGPVNGVDTLINGWANANMGTLSPSP